MDVLFLCVTGGRFIIKLMTGSKCWCGKRAGRASGALTSLNCCFAQYQLHVLICIMRFTRRYAACAEMLLFPVRVVHFQCVTKERSSPVLSGSLAFSPSKQATACARL